MQWQTKSLLLLLALSALVGLFVAGLLAGCSRRPAEITSSIVIDSAGTVTGGSAKGDTVK